MANIFSVKYNKSHDVGEGEGAYTDATSSENRKKEKAKINKTFTINNNVLSVIHCHGAGGSS